MKRMIAVILAVLMLFALTACGQKKAEPEKLGAWTLSNDATLTEDAKGVFEKALEGLVGVNYTPLVLLGTQLVSGTNYCFLCEATVVHPDAKPYYAVVSIYQNLQGETEIRNIVALDLGKIAESGVVENAGPADGQMLGAWTMDRESKIDVEGAVLHLASQVVSGTNHCILCKGWNLSFVYEDPEGKTEITKTVPLDIAALCQPAET